MKNVYIKRVLEALPRRQESHFLLHASIGLGIGLVAGVGIGLLYAPMTGTETRQKLREGAEGLRDRAKETAGRVQGELVTAAEGLRERTFAHGDTSKDQSKAQSQTHS
jgi:gas vesicle protein